MKKFNLFTLVAAFLAFSFTAIAQEYDDIYFNPSDEVSAVGNISTSNNNTNSGSEYSSNNAEYV
jgi:hypothetical protein